MMPTIFRRLGKYGYSWKIYFHDIPQTISLFDLWAKIPTHFCQFEAEFERHCRIGRLPNYSFIEPRYFPTFFSDKMPNDQHPPHNLLYGEQLIATVYNAVRNSPLWPRTLLLIVYDEHGGAFDHVVPPSAVSPGGPYPDGFRFDRYGVRVPAVIVSPYVAPGSIIRPPPGPDLGRDPRPARPRGAARGRGCRQRPRPPARPTTAGTGQRALPVPAATVDVVFVPIEGGSFVMGSNDGPENERPAHRVHVDSFALAVHQMTNAEYAAFVDATGHAAPPFWNDAAFNDPRQPDRWERILDLSVESSR